MGFFKIEDTEPKPITLETKMSSEIECKNLPDLAKHLLWIDEKIPALDREVDITRHYWDNSYTVKISWTEIRE